jgi:hypothetical protein
MSFKRRKEMDLNSFRETTVRTYDEDLVQGMYALSKGFSGTKSDFYNEILKAGVKTLSGSREGQNDATEAGRPFGDALKKRLDEIQKTQLDSFTVLSAKIDELGEKAKENIAIGSCVYHVVLCIASGDKVTLAVVEKGLFDSEPERFRKKK